jgi:hypothetical protein
MKKALASTCICLLAGCADNPGQRERPAVRVSQQDVSVARANGLVSASSAGHTQDLYTIQLVDEPLEGVLGKLIPTTRWAYSLPPELDSYADIHLTVSLTNVTWQEAMATILMRCDLVLKETETGSGRYKIEPKPK